MIDLAQIKSLVTQIRHELGKITDSIPEDNKGLYSRHLDFIKVAIDYLNQAVDRGQEAVDDIAKDPNPHHRFDPDAWNDLRRLLESKEGSNG